MSLAHNPSIVTNGLVMYYDMNNSMKSWKGAPTTNVLVDTDNLATSNWSFTLFGNWPATGATANAAIAPDGTQTATRLSASGYSRFQRYAVSANQTYTFSMWVKNVNMTGPIGIQLATGLNGSLVGYGSYYTGVSLTADWARYSYTITIPSSGVNQLEVGLNVNPNYSNANVFCDVWRPQLELQSFATPFVNGTRSSTQAIVDLTNQSTLTSASLTYNNNTFSFSESAGSTIVSTLPVGSTLPALSSFTLEAWVKVTAWPTNTTLNGYGQRDKAGTIVGGCYYAGTGIRWAGSSSGNSMYVFGFVRGADAYRNTATYNVPALNVYNHFVFTNNSPSGSMNLYVNGVLYSTVAAATQQYNPDLVSGCGNITINRADVDGGGTSVYSYLNGNIDAVKVYNRALTSAEVAQNFNAHRGRYGL